MHFGRWTDIKYGRNGRAPPVSTSKKRLLAVMAAAQEIAEAADKRVLPLECALLKFVKCRRIAEAVDKRVVLVDNTIWLLCAKRGLYLTNRELAEIAHEGESPENRAEGLGALIRSWMDEEGAGEQRETIEYLVRALDEDRLSDRKLFPGRSKSSFRH